ncbi:hypothetical protein SCHPADRAFT_911432 [Schizopora paradoxa]|uniref:Uncharacterized protein n=1 Tax=Schizopora paradoxa TaxID=27342 RepID=A0A0H2QYZ5_9AGAM|nr:hypothetical protein SCHPADRAFT_911432 [Schizopora paradoxa]
MAGKERSNSDMDIIVSKMAKRSTWTFLLLSTSCVVRTRPIRALDDDVQSLSYHPSSSAGHAMLTSNWETVADRTVLSRGG